MPEFMGKWDTHLLAHVWFISIICAHITPGLLKMKKGKSLLKARSKPAFLSATVAALSGSPAARASTAARCCDWLVCPPQAREGILT